MLPRHPLHRLTAPAGAAVLTISMLAGVALATPRPVAAQIPPQTPDLTVALTAGPTTVEPQEKMTFDATVRFRNGRIELAPQYVFDVAFDVRVPAGSTIRGIRPDGQTPMTCSQTGATTVRCQIPQMSDQQPVTTSVKVVAPAATGTHTASAQVDPQNTVQEFVESNNTATATVRVRRLFTLAEAGLADNPALRDLEVREDVSDARPLLRLPDLTIRSMNYYYRRIHGGQTADIEFEVENLGSGNAQGVVIRANVGNLLTIVSANLNGNACSAVSSFWTCTVDLPAGGGPVRLGMTVEPLLVVVGQSVTHTIAVVIDPANTFFETDESNNTASAAVIVP
jgi:Domain of unknown function DUF11/CARDB